MAATARHAARRACTSSCPAMHTEQHIAGVENLNIQMSPSLTGSLVPAHETATHTHTHTHTQQCCCCCSGYSLSDRHPSVQRQRIQPSHCASVSMMQINGEDRPVSELAAGTRRRQSCCVLGVLQRQWIICEEPLQA